MIYDKDTVQELAREAGARWDANAAEFEESDCIEARNAAESWETVYCWLLDKLEEV